MLLDREHELGVLADLRAGVSSSGGNVVLLRGEAGIGKSALVEEFIAEVAPHWHVLLGVCDDLRTPQTFGPIWDIARQEPALREPLETGDRRAVMEILLDLLSRSLRPTVLIIEDTHWADDGTLDIVKFLGRRIAKTNALLILTYRDSEVDYDHPLRRVIGELAPKNLARMSLVGLSAAAVSALFEASDIDANHVLELTDGNPLFVTEVLGSGVAGVPSSVQDSVLARATRLSAGARRTLDLVSVIPGEADRKLLESVLGSIQEELEQCMRLGLLQVDIDSVSFRHEMTRRAVESALSLEDRRRLNAAVLSASSDSKIRLVSCTTQKRLAM